MAPPSDSSGTGTDAPSKKRRRTKSGAAKAGSDTDSQTAEDVAPSVDLLGCPIAESDDSDDLKEEEQADPAGETRTLKNRGAVGSSPQPKPGSPSRQAGSDRSEYRVLARKHRPSSFADLIGQEALVRTLTNAIRQDRLAHAFMLTGVRGVGKTTTARIVARALNCLGPDGSRAAPTIEPCGVCGNCVSIAEDRNPDVLEMDAASRTGVDDVREIVEGVRYLPTLCRYKIYVIDEVHMLSKNAFNALLKTLEEPPAHVKFIFATTEIRKVPVTVLSRCQRFDLRRIEMDRLAAFFADIANLENANIEPDAVRLIARAADGSARDGLSLLDQAIAMGAEGGNVGADAVRKMLGLTDRARIYDLADGVFDGDTAKTLEIFADLYDGGADPLVLLQDLSETVYTAARIKATGFKTAPGGAKSQSFTETEATRGKALADRLSMPALTRAWQILLKGLGEVQTAPTPHQAAEMVLIRLAFAADLPDPAALVDALRHGPAAPTDAAASAPAAPLRGGGPSGGAKSAIGRSAGGAAGPSNGPKLAAIGGTAIGAYAVETADPAPVLAPVPPMPTPAAPPETGPGAEPETLDNFEAIVALFAEKREGRLFGLMRTKVHPIRLDGRELTIRCDPSAPKDLHRQIMKLLRDWTGDDWIVVQSEEEGDATLKDLERSAERARLNEAARHPLVRAVLQAFPEAKVVCVKDLRITKSGDDDE